MRVKNAQRDLLQRRIAEGKELEANHRAFLAELGVNSKTEAQMRTAGVSNIDAMLGPSPSSDHIRAKIQALAKSRLPVLVQGPPGTAKTAIASLLHFGSEREGLLRHVDMASITDDDAAEVLFGRLGGPEHGQAGRVGLVVQSHGGSLVFTRVELASERVQRLTVGIAEEKKRFLRRVGADVSLIAEIRRLRSDLNAAFGVPPVRFDAQLHAGVAETWGHVFDRFCQDLISAFERTGNQVVAKEIAVLRAKHPVSGLLEAIQRNYEKLDSRGMTEDDADYVRIDSAIRNFEKDGELNVRVISTADVDLEKRVRDGLFRKDLYDNLSASIIRLPSLNDRGEREIESFIGQALLRYGRKDVVGLDPAYDKRLVSADWSPNNLRGLRNELRRAVAYAAATDGIIREIDLHDESMLKGRLGISTLPLGRQPFETLEERERAVRIAEALTRTITQGRPSGSKSRARTYLLKSGIQVSLQTISNYLEKEQVVFDAESGCYQARLAKRR